MRKTILLIGIMTLISSVWAANVGTLIPFNTGDVLSSADLNANFSAVKTAVDDNATVIANNTAAIGAKVNKAGDTMTGTLVAPAVVVSGNITVAKVVYQAPRTHFLSFADAAFYSADARPHNISFGNGGAWIAQAGFGVLVTPVQLPQNATITNFTIFLRNSVAADFEAWLFSRTYAALGLTIQAKVESTGFGAGALEELSAPLALNIDNFANVYGIRMHSLNWPGNANLKVMGALIEYTLNEAL